MTSNLRKIRLHGKCGNEHGGRLLAALHENTSASSLELVCSHWNGIVGGAHISALLLTNPHLKEFILRDDSTFFKLYGARVFQACLRTNCARIKPCKRWFCLAHCTLGDEGFLVLVKCTPRKLHCKIAESHRQFYFIG